MLDFLVVAQIATHKFGHVIKAERSPDKYVTLALMERLTSASNFCREPPCPERPLLNVSYIFLALHKKVSYNVV